MRRTTLLVTAVVFALILASGVALAEVVKGTARDDTLRGQEAATSCAATATTTP